MSRAEAIDLVREHFRSGAFLTELSRRVAYRTVSQNSTRRDILTDYLTQELQPTFAELGFTTELIDAPSQKGPALIARREEDSTRPTVLMYGHGDVVPGMEGQWRDGLEPWRTTTEGERVYGRGIADNKGQHSILLSALRSVRDARGGKLGFNAKFIVEMGEETGSPDLRSICAAHRDALKADLFLASDGPRLSAQRPTIFLGCRGGHRIHLTMNLRDGAHHSGNWGGVLSNAATILSNAIAALVDAQGHMLLDALKPPPISNAVRAALADVKVEPGPDEPQLSENWGEDGFTPAERLYAWNTLEVLALNAGNTKDPANAIPGHAEAVLQLRFVVGTKIEGLAEAIRAHLKAHGLAMVQVEVAQRFIASRTDIDNPWVAWAAQSIERTTGKKPALLPNFGGSLPNDVFAEVLKLPTIWVPHSYPGCSQHAPNEHILLPMTEEALCLMAGLFWDLGEAKRLT
ncbi:MAG TPA: M20 family metallopeptidase [Pseudolabrys sp.]|nr:M20 family metallopeptidase [Pseudolabrys sp.]